MLAAVRQATLTLATVAPNPVGAGARGATPRSSAARRSDPRRSGGHAQAPRGLDPSVGARRSTQQLAAQRRGVDAPAQRDASAAARAAATWGTEPPPR
jgi:hypothetical protein